MNNVAHLVVYDRTQQNYAGANRLRPIAYRGVEFLVLERAQESKSPENESPVNWSEYIPLSNSH